MPRPKWSRLQSVEGALQCAHGDRAQTIALLDRFTLLTDSQHAIDGAGRGRHYDGIDAAAAARKTPTACMKHDGPVAGGCQHLRQGPLRLVNGHARGARPDLLVAVRVTDQHALLPSVRFQVALVKRIGQQLLHRLPATLEAVYRLELRCDIESYLTGLFVVNGGPTCKQECSEHVVRALRAAYNEVADRLGTVAVPPLHDGFVHGEIALT